MPYFELSMRVEMPLNSITISPQEGEVIGGLASYVINVSYGSVTLYSNGVGGWFVVT